MAAMKTAFWPADLAPTWARWQIGLGCVCLLLVAGCGLSNQTLKTEHRYWPLAQDDRDDTMTIGKVASEYAVTTEYSLRYTVKITAPAGPYLLRGTDPNGGRYFEPMYNRGVQLVYTGATVMGSAKPEVMRGGVHLDARGAASLYWFWDSNYMDTAARVPAPGLEMTLSTEIDSARRQARLDREAAAQRAEALRQAEIEKRRALAAELAAARDRARVQCAAEQCERDFAQAQVYLLKHADMRIQVATPTLIETYNATSEGSLQMRLLRAPIADGRWEIVLTVHCREESKPTDDRCSKRLIDAYKGFLPHMQRQ